MNQISSLIYQLSISVFGGLIRLNALWNKKARLWLDGRKNLKRKYKENKFSKRPIWVHCASLGEFEQGRPIIEKIKEEHPDIPILLTFFSPSGYEPRSNYGHADHVTYIGLDTRENAKFFINNWTPRMAIFIKYDFWMNHLHQLEENGIPIIVASAIFRKSNYFFKWYGKGFLPIFRQIEHFFVQDENSRSLLNAHQIDQVSVVGDTRLDRVLQILQAGKHVPQVKRYCEKQKVIVAGSTWPEDEAILYRWIEKYDTSEFDKLIIVPHEVNEAHIRSIEDSCPRETIRLSNYTEADKDKIVLIVDSIGQLSKIYRYARLAYIGGGFGEGIHNILEPAAYKIPIVFGPNHAKSKEAQDFIEIEVAQEIKDAETLNDALTFLLKKQEKGWIERQLEDYFTNSRGATDFIIEMVNEIIEEEQIDE